MKEDPRLRWFGYSHLPERLQAVSRSFHFVATIQIDNLPDGYQKDICLQKLLEAKDAAVRAELCRQSDKELES